MQLAEIKKVIIAGAGTMGTSMAQIFAQYGYDTTLYNHREATLQRAKEMIRMNQQALVKSGDLTTEESMAVQKNIGLTADKTCFANCDFVVESIVENLEIKQEFWRDISRLVKPSTLLATNTSGISITKIAALTEKPARFCGMHWFNPPHLVPLVEVIKGEHTDEETARTVFALAEKIGKKPVLVKKDAKGFIGNRIQLAVLREALHIVKEGIADAKDVDNAMKYGLGFRYACLGPLETADFGGLDIFYHVAEYLLPDLDRSAEVPPLLKEKYEKGELGIKTQQGFYSYPEETSKKAIQERDEKFIRLFHALYQK